jgi:hypothetical protein
MGYARLRRCVNVETPGLKVSSFERRLACGSGFGSEVDQMKGAAEVPIVKHKRLGRVNRTRVVAPQD